VEKLYASQNWIISRSSLGFSKSVTKEAPNNERETGSRRGMTRIHQSGEILRKMQYMIKETKKARRFK